jgi:hypothetical protein
MEKLAGSWSRPDAIFDRGRLQLESFRSRRVALELRAEGKNPPAKFVTNFREASSRFTQRFAALDLAQQLYWEYIGCHLPRPKDQEHRLTDNMNSTGNLSDEERELTDCEHQGEMDRFVLEWCMIYRRGTGIPKKSRSA